MYEKVLNERAVAGDIVDRLRDSTNAPLASCIEAARAIIDSLSDYIQEDSFDKIAHAVRSFEVDVDSCRDSKLLEMLVTGLGEIFGEKEELSYSVSQNDDQLIEFLTLLTDIVDKTDPKISMKAVSRHDFDWLNSLINLFQMDQNDRVRSALVDCLDVLTRKCPDVIPFLMESKLFVVIALQIPPASKPLSAINIGSLVVLARAYSTSIHPPLSHFDTINSSFVERLLAHFEQHQDVILDCLLAVSHAVPQYHDNPVTSGLSACRIPLFGEVFTTHFNKKCSTLGLKLLRDMVGECELLRDLFYSNDLTVLKHVLGRELVNNEDEKVRLMCFDVIGELVKTGVSCNDIREYIEHCSAENVKKVSLLEAIDTA